MESASIDLLIKACEKAVQLLKIREDRNRLFIAELIDPIYEKLRIVVNDYHQFFIECDRSLGPRLQGYDEVLGRLQQSRDKFFICRAEVHAFAQSIWSGTPNSNDPIDEFAEAMCSIFYCNEIEVLRGDNLLDKKSRASTLIGMIDSWERIDILDPEPKIGALHLQIRASKLAVEQGWARTSKAYNVLRIKNFNLKSFFRRFVK